MTQIENKFGMSSTQQAPSWKVFPHVTCGSWEKTMIPSSLCQWVHLDVLQNDIPRMGTWILRMTLFGHAKTNKKKNASNGQIIHESILIYNIYNHNNHLKSYMNPHAASHLFLGLQDLNWNQPLACGWTTHLKNMLVKNGFIFPNFRGESKIYVKFHHLVEIIHEPSWTHMQILSLFLGPQDLSLFFQAP